MEIIVFLFHRDLRLVDHNSLYFIKEELLKLYKNALVLPMFVFTPDQVSEKNPYKSQNSIQFIIESLIELNKELRKKHTRLHCFYGDTVEILQGLQKQFDKILAVVETKDYTPYAKKRETDLRLWCMSQGIDYSAVEDIYLTNPGTIRTQTGKVFQKFTPFWETARQVSVSRPRGIPDIPWFFSSRQLSGEIHLFEIRKKLVPKENLQIHVKGGRTEGIHLLSNLPKNYNSERDFPAKRSSNLSAHNHFGTVSIREVYWAGKKAKLSEFVRQLYWRDFYGHIMDAFTELYGIAPFDFMNKPDHHWKTDRTLFQKWCEGKTGHELVDAGMRQLNETGFMHNRVRLVCASYLVKDLGIFWRWGERYFAKKLVDYDVTQNMMNWIWVSSLLPFASAPFRRHDPEIQAEKLNGDRQYRNKWLIKLQ